MNYEIFPMSERHVQGVYEIEKNSFHTPWSFEQIAGELDNKNACYLVAVDGEKIQGYLGAHIVLDEGYITNIAVRAGCRRRGIASGLLLEFFDENGGVNKVTLEVRVSNLPAIKLYERFGFKIVSARKNYYKNPDEDAYLMEWRREV